MIVKQVGSSILFNADCLDVMPTLPRIDMVLTDPPYGTTACKWDSVIPLEAMWAGIQACTGERAAVVLTASQPFTTTLIASNMRGFKYCWYWGKNFKTGHLNAKIQPMRSVEDVAVFYLRQPTYLPQGIKRHEKVKNRGVGPSTNRKCGSVNIQSHTGYPDQLLTFSRDVPSIHPTQKPVALMEYLIKTYTEPGQTVLDFTMGSGTTGVACVNLGRSFIGIELDPEYFDVAVNRIRGAAK